METNSITLFGLPLNKLCYITANEALDYLCNFFGVLKKDKPRLMTLEEQKGYNNISGHFKSHGKDIEYNFKITTSLSTEDKPLVYEVQLKFNSSKDFDSFDKNLMDKGFTVSFNTYYHEAKFGNYWLQYADHTYINGKNDPSKGFFYFTDVKYQDKINAIRDICKKKKQEKDKKNKDFWKNFNIVG
jgi:hypothetical protein